MDLEVRGRNKQDVYVPIKEKLNLSIKEAVEYSGIGESTIRKLLHERGCSFLLKIGNKQLIKRKEFEEYLNGRHCL